MADAKIFAGPRVRRLRGELGLTQTAMAARLEISPSYLNLIERNQRPLTAQMLLRLASTFDVDIRQLQPAGEGGSVAALKEVFADPLLDGELASDGELLDLSEGSPNAALAMVKLYRAYREQQGRLADLSRLVEQGATGLDLGTARPPLETVRAAFEAAPWCFPALERVAGRIVADLPDAMGRMAALYALLREAHHIHVQVLPVETMPVWRKRFDRHSRRLFLSERLTRPQRALLLAQELVTLRADAVLDEEVALMKIEGEAARRLARMELSRYAALAVLMPYERFRTTAERVAHDPAVLAARFESDFALVAERLVSLQDRSEGRRAGLPFFAIEVDQAGTVLRRIGAKGFPAAVFGGECPKLALHAAFATPGEVIAERVEVPDATVFLTLSRTVDGPHAGAGERPRRTAILLGLEDVHAGAVTRASRQRGEGKRVPITVDGARDLASLVAQARLLPDPALTPPLPIGPACRLCERLDCTARSAPPLTRPQSMDTLVEGFGAHGLT